MLSNIRIVLIRTFHPGNIGSAARAMKTMGLSQLYLVDPWLFPDPEASKMAASAEDILDQAIIVSTLEEAVKDCHIVAATTARVRGYDLPEVNPETCAKQLLHTASQGNVALVFGPERYGIKNEDIQLANYRVTIPANPEYSSLNLASAVQTLCYEIYKNHLTSKNEKPLDISNIDTRDFPSSEDLERFYVHFEKTYQNTGFIRKAHPGEIMQRVRNLYARAHLDKMELNILRGMLSSVDKAIKRNHEN